MQELTDNPTIESPALQPSAKDAALEGVGSNEFPSGEIEAVEAAPNPASIIERFVKHRSSSVREAVLSTVAFSKGMFASKKHRGERQQLLDGMVKVKAFSKTESAALSDSNKTTPTISKLLKIAEYSRVLQDEKIATLMQPGYTTAYACAQLYEALVEIDPEAAFDTLHGLLGKHDGPATRGFFEKERDKLKPAKRIKTTESVPVSDSPVEAPADHQESKPPSGGKIPSAPTSVDEVPIVKWSNLNDDDNVIEEAPEAAEGADQLSNNDGSAGGIEDGDEVEADHQEPISVVLMRLDEDAISRLSDVLVDLADVCDNIADDALLMVNGPLGFILSRHEVLENFGMDRCERVFLLNKPEFPDVTNGEALAVYVRGNATISGGMPGWITENDSVALADLVAGHRSGRKVMVFGRTQAPGWESIADR